MVTKELKTELEDQGYARTGEIGGAPKLSYWTPDGRVIKALPSMHAYAKKIDGKMVNQGVRDANLDNGWLTSKPTELQLRCYYCDKWHPTEEEVEACGDKKKASEAKFTKQAKEELKSEDTDRIGKLETDMSEIKNLLKQLVKGASDG